MLATALLPTFAAIGAAAGWLLLLLRCVISFSVGGEYTGVVAYLLEGASQHKRGLIASLASASSEIGALVAVGVSALTVHGLSTAELEDWGWRIPFLIGAALAGTVWIARSAMQESPDFERQRAAGTAPARPLRYTMAHHRKGIFRSFAISALGSITYYVGITYVPAFLTSAGALTEGSSLWLSTLAAIVVIAVTPLVGALSDRLGRRPVLLLVGFMSTVLPATMFSLMASGSALRALFGAVILAAVAGGVSAVGCGRHRRTIPRRRTAKWPCPGDNHRHGRVRRATPWLAQLLVERTGWPVMPGVMIALVGVIVLPVILDHARNGAAGRAG